MTQLFGIDHSILNIYCIILTEILVYTRGTYGILVAGNTNIAQSLLWNGFDYSFIQNKRIYLNE